MEHPNSAPRLIYWLRAQGGKIILNCKRLAQWWAESFRLPRRRNKKGCLNELDFDDPAPRQSRRSRPRKRAPRREGTVATMFHVYRAWAVTASAG